MRPIHLFRDDIKEGQVFIAHVDSVEGHTRITLVPDNDYWARQDNPEAYENTGEMEQQEILDRQEDDSFTDMDGDEALNGGVNNGL